METNKIIDKNLDKSNEANSTPEVIEKEIVVESDDNDKIQELQGDADGVDKSIEEELENADTLEEQEMVECPNCKTLNVKGSEKCFKCGCYLTETEEDKKVDEAKGKSAYDKYKNIDWSKLSPKKVLEINAELLLENKRLVQEAIQNKNYIDELEHSNLSVVETKKQLNQYLDYIAGKIFSCNSIIQRLNSGEKISLAEKADLIIRCVTDNETRLMNNYQRAINKIKDFKIIQDNLQKQIYDLSVNRGTKVIKTSETIDDSGQSFNADEINEMINLTPKSNDIVFTATPISKVQKVCDNDVAKAILEAVGSKGISETPEIYSFCVEKAINDQKATDMIYTLIQEKVLSEYMAHPLNRNRGVRLVELTQDVGVRIYKEFFKKDPVKSEMSIIKAENDNYDHGYSIKDTVTQLKAFGYKSEDISMDRKKNTITLSGSVTYIPDIIAKHPITKVQEYYEVETGKCNRQELEAKLSKAVLVTNKLKIIVPNKMVANEYLENVSNWYNKSKTAPAIQFIIQTFQEFKTRDKLNTRYFPKMLKEDVNVGEELLQEIKQKQQK